MNQNHPKGSHMPKGESLTQRHFAAQADINTKVAKHLRSVPGANLSNIGQGGTRQPIFGDFTRIDYQDMLNKVTDIDQQFQALPGRVRNRFRNRPDQLLAFLEDPKNLKEAVKLGLCKVPDGCSVTPEGDIIENEDLEKHSKDPNSPSQNPLGNNPANQAQKADPEAQPGFNQNGGKK